MLDLPGKKVYSNKYNRDLKRIKIQVGQLEQKIIITIRVGYVRKTNYFIFFKSNSKC